MASDTSPPKSNEAPPEGIPKTTPWFIYIVLVLVLILIIIIILMFVALRDPSFKNYQKKKCNKPISSSFNNLTEQRQPQPLPFNQNQNVNVNRRVTVSKPLSNSNVTAPIILSVAQDNHQITYITGKNFSETGCFVMHQEKVLETKLISKELLSCVGVPSEDKNKVRVINSDSQSFVLEESFLSFAPLSNAFRSSTPHQNVKVIFYGNNEFQQKDTITLQILNVDTQNVHSKLVIECQPQTKVVTFVDAFQPSLLSPGTYRLLAQSQRFPNLFSSAFLEVQK